MRDVLDSFYGMKDVPEAKRTFIKATVRLAFYVIDNQEEEQCLGVEARKAYDALKEGGTRRQAMDAVLNCLKT